MLGPDMSRSRRMTIEQDLARDPRRHPRAALRGSSRRRRAGYIRPLAGQSDGLHRRREPRTPKPTPPSTAPKAPTPPTTTSEPTPTPSRPRTESRRKHPRRAPGNAINPRGSFPPPDAGDQPGTEAASRMPAADRRSISRANAHAARARLSPPNMTTSPSPPAPPPARHPVPRCSNATPSGPPPDETYARPRQR